MSTLELFFWRVVDWFDYWVWDVRLRIFDAMHGLERETETGRERNRRPKLQLQRSLHSTEPAHCFGTRYLVDHSVSGSRGERRGGQL